MGNNIKISMIENYIKENNLSKNEFCRLCRISPNTLYKIINNDSNMKIIAIIKIARVINVQLFQMFE